MNINIVFKYTNDWYVGEIYNYIANKFIEKYSNISFKIIDSYEYQKKYNLSDYMDSFPSVVNKYNLIFHNIDNNKTFINSLNDYAPFCFYPRGGSENFDIQTCSFCSNYTQENIEPILKYNPVPSFYILENWSDLERIKKYRKTTRSKNKAYFLGLIYGARQNFLNIFANSQLFDFYDKSNPLFFKNKDEYFEELSQYIMSFSVDGAAQICHRDIESLGIGNLLVRESLEIETYNCLTPNKHYLELITKEEKKILFDIPNILNVLEDKLYTVINNNLYKDIIEEGILWYDQNCTPESQFTIIESISHNLEILR
jgi:hypothetical protein